MYPSPVTEAVARVLLGLASLGALIAALAWLPWAASARPRAGLWYPSLLVMALVVGAGGWLSLARAGEGLLSSPLLALAGLGLGLIAWELVLPAHDVQPPDARYPRGRSAATVVGLLMAAAGLAVGALGARAAGAEWLRGRFWLDLGDTLFLLGASRLLAALLACGKTPQEGGQACASAIACALVCQTLALFCRGVGAQVLWGRYWSWAPLECWRAAAWSLVALLAAAQRSLGFGEARPWLPLALATVSAALTLFAASPVARLLHPGALLQ